MAAREGLEWEDGFLSTEPRWAFEPSTDIIKELACHHLHLSEDDASRSTLTFEVQGAFNKLYAFECPQGSYLMRVSLPVDPRYKTLSETATIQYLRSKTTIPVPEVLAYDASAETALKFEWMLMERIMAKPLGDILPSMDWEAKVALVKKIVEVMAQLFHLRFTRIGNLFQSQHVRSSCEVEESPLTTGGLASKLLGAAFRLLQTTFHRMRNLLPHPHIRGDHQPDDTSIAGNVVVDRIVSMPFFWDKRFTMDVSRGPFPSSREWLLAHLALIEGDCDIILQDKDAEPDDIEETERTKAIISRLRDHLPRFFPSNETETESFAISHEDINHHNILVDESGTFKALVDWECVSVLPLWKVCRLPEYLDGPECHVKPDPISQYKGVEDELYQLHLKKYEYTLLRSVFLDEMRVVDPEWIQEYERSIKRADFGKAVESCDVPWKGTVENWLDALDEGGEYERL